MADTRIYAFAIYHILKEYSDEEHPLSNSEIIHLLKMKYDIEISQRTVINNIEALIDFDIDIAVYLENRKGYYLRDRLFEDSEIHLLCNCIHSSHFIPENASKELIKKLSTQQNKYKQHYFTSKGYIQNSKKTKNKDLMLNIETLIEAINEKKLISLDYLTYDYNKKLVLKRKEKYNLHPYYIIQENDNLYLLCRGKNHSSLSFYRIDKMRNISILTESANSLDTSFDPYAYAKNKKFMFSGEPENIYLKCQKRMLDDLIDQFGHSIMITKDPKDDNYFFVRLKSTRQGIIYFALQYLNFCEIVEPQSMRDDMIDILKNKIKDYSKKY